MGNLNRTVLTKKGMVLATKAYAGMAQIEFTKMAVGDGDYVQNEDLEQMVELKSKKQEFNISSTGIVDDETVYIKSVITNQIDGENLAEGYYVKEIGLYANDPNEGEILYAVTTAIENQWDYLPSYSGMPVNIIMEFHAQVGNATAVMIAINSSTYALAEDLARFDQQKTDKTYVDTALDKKVDKENGKELSTNDYTTTEKNKLAGIAVGANNYEPTTKLSGESIGSPPSMIMHNFSCTKYPDGMMAMWGTGEGTNVYTNEITRDIRFSEPFINECIIFQISDMEILSGPSKWGFTATVTCEKNAHGDFIEPNWSWIAIGRWK